jgi:hypothetical protein
MILGLHGGEYLAYIMRRYEGTYHAILVGLHGGLYLAYITERY